MEEHQCLWNQGLINTEDCITVQTEVSPTWGQGNQGQNSSPPFATTKMTNYGDF